MWRLFKEVFKSLSKNKVIVAGLSILVFLTSAIFTLLSNVRSSMVGGFNDYKNVSRLQDVNVDLNLPMQGSAYNQGYYINGEKSDDFKGKDKNYTPIIYQIDPQSIKTSSLPESVKKEYYDSTRNILYFGNNKTEYLPFSSIGNIDQLLNAYYFKKEDLLNLYSIYKAEQNIDNNPKPDINFDLKNLDNLNFELKEKDRYLNIYNKVANDVFEQVFTDKTLEQSGNVKFDKTYKIGNLMNLIKKDDQIYATQLSSLFINVETKEITANFSKGKNWIDQEKGIEIKPNELAELFDFEPSSFGSNTPSGLVFKQKNKSADLSKFINYSSGIQEINENLDLKTEWKINEIFSNTLSPIKAQKKLKLEKGKKFTLPIEWIVQEENKVKFLRWNYYTSFVDKDGSKDKWLGAFKTFMEDLIESSRTNPEKSLLLDKLTTFSYWRKSKINKLTPYKSDKSLDVDKQIEKSSDIPLGSSFNYFELTQVDLYTEDKRIRPDGNKYQIDKDNSRPINKIERETKNVDDKISFLSEINNENIKDERFSIIKNEAYETTKRKIINQIAQKVKIENIGLRKTMTVDGINEETGKQNTFHFISTGNENYVVDGVKQNVGKLYDEYYDPSVLNKVSQSQNNVYETHQLTPYVSSLVIQSIGRNLYPDPKYIRPAYHFAKLLDYNINSGELKESKNTKIIPLTNFVPHEQNVDGSKTPDYNLTNLGVVFLGNKFKIARRVKDANNKYIEPETWETIYPDKMPQSGMDRGLLSKWMEKYQLTIATKFIRTQNGGWVKKDSTFQNVSYIPMLFLSPKAQLVQDVLSYGKVDYLASAIEKYLLNFDLVKQQFITPEQVYQLTSVLKKVLNDNNFASVFASSKMNKKILPKIIFDFVYELSHYEGGDVLKSVFFSILEQAKAKIKSRSSLVERKAYLTSEVENLYKLIKDIVSIDLSKYLSAQALVDVSHDPNKFIDAIWKIIDSIDFKKFSNFSHEWYKSESDKKIIFNNKEYAQKLSTGLIIKWLFNSIDQKSLKEGLKLLIDNLDIAASINLDNSSSLLYNLLIKFSPSLINGLKPIIKKMNADTSNPPKPYSNVKEGLINILTNIDFNILASELNQMVKRHYLDYKVIKFNSELNKDEEKIHPIVLDSISPKDGMIAFLRSMFGIHGSNRAFKDNLIKMFNLSDKYKEIELLNSSKKIYIPDKDDNKVGFIDFLEIFASGLSNTEVKEFNNYKIEQQFLALYSSIQNLDEVNGSVNLDLLKESQKRILKQYGLFSSKTYKTDILAKIEKIIGFINQTKGGASYISNESNKTGSDLLNDLQNFENNGTWSIIKKLLSSLSTPTIQNEYALGAQAFSIYNPWIQMFMNKDANHSQAVQFVNDFINLALDSEIFDINKKITENDNIPFAGITDYGLLELLDDPEKSNLFAFDNSGKFVNNKVEEFVTKNEVYRQWIKKNKLLLLKQLGYITASKIYSNSSEYSDGVYLGIIRKFLNNYLFKKDFFEIREQAHIIMSTLNLSLPLQIFGLSEALVDPILRFTFPEITLSYLASQKSNVGLVKANLQYLLLNKIDDFEKIVKDGEDKFNTLSSILESAFSKKDTSLVPLDIDDEQTLVLDGATFDKFKGISSSLFGIDFIKFTLEVINTIVEPKEIKDIVFNNSNSYLAKVNYAYLVKNNKAIYTGQIPGDPFELLSLLEKLDEKYVLNVNGTKFIIVGQETTVDYMYPVIDEYNLQVNTQSQALVYVNEHGFDRIRSGYVGNVVKKVLYVKNSKATGLSNVELKKYITNIIDKSITDNNKLQRVFLADEIDLVNPERALRITTVQGIIKAVSTTTIALVSVFVTLVAISTIFIIKRYIASKNKVIGILVAQGYQTWQISLSFTTFALVTSVIGGVLGYVIGYKNQLLAMNVINTYWTLPKNAIGFNFFTLFFTVFLPFLGMSLLIFVVSLFALRHKPIDLISGVNEIPQSKFFKAYQKSTRKFNVKKRFSLTLAFTSFWKLISFTVSVMLTGVATLFGVANTNVFNRTINDTYKNRSYTFKVDLETPTREGGPFKPFKPLDLNNNLYTPLGDISDGNREAADYFKPGYSSIINKNGKNGPLSPDPDKASFDSHILSQFSVNVAVAAGVAVDPWQVAYNGMPDTQKAKIDKIRDRVGYQLERTQETTDKIFNVDPNTYAMSFVSKTNNQKLDFFKYYRSPYEKQGSFKYAHWDENSKTYQMLNITTDKYRDEFRDFLVNGYKEIAKKIKAEKEDPNLIKTRVNKPGNLSDYWLTDKSDLSGPTIQDYFISFGGVYFDEKYDEKYTYLKVSNNNNTFKIYGYQKNSRFVKLIDKDNKNLYDSLYEFDTSNNIYPLVLNEVTSNKYNYKIGDLVKFEILNHVDRFTNRVINKLDKSLQNGTNLSNQSITFKVVGINPTYINNELITTIDAANKLSGLDTFKNNLGFKPFNGIMTNNPVPSQVIDSASLYSPSGYWSAYDGFDLSGIDENTLKSMFEQIYNPTNGVLKNILVKKFGNNETQIKNQIMNFLDSNEFVFDQAKYEQIKNSPKSAIEVFAKLYDSKLYIALGTSIDSKDIEAGFTSQVGSTIGTISTSIIAISFIISLVILIIMSTIMISENEKNIAIWSILGYTQKEKLGMFFGVFIPFIILAIALSIPVVLLMIFTFNKFLLASSSISLPLVLTPLHVFLTTIVIFAIFIATSFVTWYSIAKMKPVDLLKGK
ncbi:ABC transporter permease [Mycoplasmopsis caviae]|uniref:ABC transporter permease n=1 Tax=Mycoplasmopsis caviae TaxID=55603 RepID=A0A3P8LAS3_9BACT|nr:FtsX-like permease family protein [Mycoplasmopsis caviae]UUD35245.1 ABC transporter permease [Mycoplasmopsis caviae]VDR41971.1 Uncharacterized ABC transporter permease MG468 homolog [Mycoplasmopsis caviae]